MLQIPAMPSLLAAVEDGRWALGLCDPTPMGWATVGGYLLAAALCMLWAKPSGAWLLLPAMLAAAMTLLAVNKQLDLQSLLTEIGRDAAKAQGWYEDRQTFQTIFIAAIGGGATLGFAAMLWMLRRRWRESTLPLVGVAFLLAFVVVRAASFHHVDQGLGETWIGLRFNWILELGGIAMVGAGAIAGWRARRTHAIKRPDSSTASNTDRPSENRVEPAGVVSGAVAAEETPPRADRPRSRSLEGFVVRPIRISNGPRSGRAETERPPLPPPRVVS